jgi:hypothetical protein
MERGHSDLVADVMIDEHVDHMRTGQLH